LRNQLSSEHLDAILRSTVSVIAGAVRTLLYSSVLTAMLLLELRRFAALMDQGLSGQPIFAQAPAVARAAIAYFAVRIRINLLTALMATVVLLILGVDDALLWGVGVFFLSFLPYIGLVVALIPPTILAFAEYGLDRALVVVIAGVVINLVAENLLEPFVTGRALRLSPSVVFVSFFFWVWVLGPIGALLSMPIMVLLLLLFDSSDESRWLARLLGSASVPTAGTSQPPPPPVESTAARPRR
jgi:predicted PurR-regulated permease PerM